MFFFWYAEHKSQKFENFLIQFGCCFNERMFDRSVFFWRLSSELKLTVIWLHVIFKYNNNILTMISIFQLFSFLRN